MNRRLAMKSIGGLVGAVFAFGGVHRQQNTFGYLSPSLCLGRGLNPSTAKVFLDGVDVTAQRVLACDDRAGFVEVLARNARGYWYLDGTGSQLARVRRYGQVRVTFGG